MFVKLGTAAVERVLNREEFNTRLADRKIVEYDPEYVYVVVRALSADRPNSNGDCFPHEELIRLDPVLHRPVYASFIGKGVYINHQHTDDPRYAKGIILDSRYVQSNTEDKYVELLLGIDKQKDPVFARDVERVVPEQPVVTIERHIVGWLRHFGNFAVPTVRKSLAGSQLVVSASHVPLPQSRLLTAHISV